MKQMLTIGRILALAAVLAVAPSGWGRAADRGDKVVVSQAFHCGGELRRQWEGTVKGAQGSFLLVRPDDRDWCPVPQIRVWRQRTAPLPVKRPHDCP